MEKATLYYHVKGKEDLLYLITKSSVETLQEEVAKAVEGITSPLEHLAVLIRAHCMSLLRDQTQHATSLAEVRALSPERLAEIVSLRKTYQTGIRRIIEAGQKNGSIRADVEPRYLASMLRGLLDRTVEWYQKGGSLGPAELAGLLLRDLSVRSTEASALRARSSRTATERRWVCPASACVGSLFRFRGSNNR